MIPAKKVHIISLGCPKNLVDSEVMGGEITKNGMQLVNRRELADIVIVNTCAFIRSAKEEALEEILTLAAEKKEGSRPFHLVVAGCLAQRYGKELFHEIPEVDLFLGVGEVANIARNIKNIIKKKSPRTAVITKPDFLMTAQHTRILPASALSTYLKISDGCSNRCTYCVIPEIRGKARSRRPDDILQEAQTLAERGIKEIIITGQDTTVYGKDLPGRPRLSDILRDIAGIRGIEWIRLLYAHPAHITEDVMQAVADENKICRYIDLPVQHIDDTILMKMNRKVTAAGIRKTIERARVIVPGVALRTSIIAGFPGETPKRFEKLLEFIREIKFDHLGVFTYSREEGTKAALFRSRIAEAEKEYRRDIIMNEQAVISNKINQNLVGSIQEVLLEGKSDRAGYSHVGRSRRQAPEIDGVTYVRGGKAKTGSIVRCKITAAEDYDLFARIID
ncbi:MAG: Ribosomal protein S12 methylthiotransferase RimO [Smithella sp. PtaU1.Bin162]|nr:MAG: Ribosomal protein S12 methylthiotransferase RimO [Smithella sp. PtaU1.Bin162]